MAERLPVGATANSKSLALPSLPSRTLADASNASLDHFHDQIPGLLADSNGLNGLMLSNGSATPSSNHSSHQSGVGSSEATRNGTRTREGEPHPENEWVEQDEPGVYITFVSLPGGIKDLKRVRFRYVFLFPTRVFWHLLCLCNQFS